MDIITRQVCGGFRARFSDSTDFATRGKTRGEAVGNLVLSARVRLGINRLLWDRKDEWTLRYLEGKPNRKKSRPTIINFQRIPSATSVAMARRITITQLEDGIPRTLFLALCSLTGDFGGSETLGAVCKFNEEQVKQKYPLSNYNFGEKKYAYLQRLLKHYGLSLK